MGMKKRISFFMDLTALRLNKHGEENTEGRTKIALVLKNVLEKKGYQVTFNSMKADLIHVHSSGVAPSFLIKKFKQKKVPAIFSLYSVCESNPFLVFINSIRDIPLRNLPILIVLRVLILHLISTGIPLRVKGYNLKHFDQVIVPSKYIQRRLFSNTKIIHLGIDTEKFKPIKNKKKSDKLIVGYVGHFSAFKGVYELIEASKGFGDDIETHFYLNIIGHVDLRRLRNIVHKHNKKAKVFGKCKDINIIYNKIDILVYPIKLPVSAIANPLVLLEGMSCGCAIITSNVPNVTEIVKGSAITIKPNSKEIVKAVNQLRDNDLRKKLGKSARDIVKKDYDEKIMLKEYLDLYTKILK